MIHPWQQLDTETIPPNRCDDGMVRDHFLVEIVDREEVGEGVDNVEEGVGMAVVHTGLPLFSVLQAFF